eukprot:jgi/Chrzof1/5121/Cz15g12070.t1
MGPIPAQGCTSSHACVRSSALWWYAVPTWRRKRAYSEPTSCSAQEDPIEAAISAAAEQGVKVTWHHHDDDDDWADVMEDLEDPWMRNPAVPELLEETGIDPSTIAAQMRQQQQPEPQQQGLPAGSLSVASVNQVELELLLKQPQPSVLLDVRSEQEYKQGHHPHAVNCPIEQLTADKSHAWKGRTVVVIDTQNHRSHQACVRLLKVHGLQDVRHYDPSS